MELLESVLALGAPPAPAPPAPRPPGLRLIFPADTDTQEDISTIYESQLPAWPFQESDVFEAPVLGGRVLCASNRDYKAVYELTLDAKELASSNFKPGDSIGIIPRNDKKDVEMFLERLGLLEKADLPYLIENVSATGKTSIPKHVPKRSTLRYTFTNCVDLRAVVKKLFLLALSTFTIDENEKHCLEILCSKDGSHLYNEQILNKNMCIIDILHALPSCKPSVACILAHLTRLLPRPYSIINSRQTDSNIIKMCFSVMNVRANRKGLTTGWLENIIVDLNKTHSDHDDIGKQLQKLSLQEVKSVKVPIYLRKSLKFILPNDVKQSVLMIGAGTGVAPYLGFLEERMILKKQDPQLQLGETWLFYGCRNPDVDYIYKMEINNYFEQEILTKLSTSFSRIDNNGVKYVQDAIKANGKDVVQFIENGASVYVCGDLSVMAKQVQVAIIQCLVEFTARTVEEANLFIKSMENEDRYLVDLWS